MLASPSSWTSIAIIALSMFGILMNTIHIWISTKTKDRRAILDVSTLTACVAATLNGVQLLVRSVVRTIGHDSHSVAFKVFGKR